jgi:hypothetical protein
MGTESRLVPTGGPIRGLAMMTSENDLALLEVMVPSGERDLATTIINSVRQSKKSLEPE